MPNRPEIAIVACGVLSIDLKQAASELGIEPRIKLLPGGLHNTPQELRRRVQQAVDVLSENECLERILIGYGICGMGTVGIHARGIPLAIPRVHDCIALFLGNDAAYRREFRRYPGTYYISAGWYEENTEPLTQKRPYVFMGDRRVYFDELVQQCGEEQAKRTFDFFNSWKKNYQRAAFIDTGVGRPEVYAAHAREMAQKNNWRYERLEGGRTLLRELMTASVTTDSILVVPPGHCTVFDPRERGLSSRPIGDRVEGWTLGVSRTEHIWAAGNHPKGRPRFGLGIDAGGTYTDAVVFDLSEGRLLSKSKALTTKYDFTEGIGRSLSGLEAHLLKVVELVSVSTTLATNAIVEDKGCRVGLLLMPPFESFDVRRIGCRPLAVIGGRMTIEGGIVEPVDTDEIRRTVREMMEKNAVSAFAVSGYGGSVNPALELEVKRIVREETGCVVTCGHELSQILDFQTRARTAVLNGRIVPLLVRFLEDLRRNLEDLGITAPMMVVKGDGTLMSAAMAVERPVETIFSGPAASVAGARYLTGIQDALVVDMGGTTTDTAFLADDRVKVNEEGCRIAGIRTHVKSMEIRTTGIGGDSLIRYEKNRFIIGPRRVAPVAWLGDTAADTGAALDYMEAHLARFRGAMQDAQLLTLTGHDRRVELTDDEKRIVERLLRRPYTMDELARETGWVSSTLLPLNRLEDMHMVQRCGLTPTDLLHQTGQFRRWDTDTATRLCTLMATLADMSVEKMVSGLMDQIIRQLAMELMKRQLEEEIRTDAFDSCDLCATLADRMLSDSANGYRIRFELHRPVIGIGAPIGHFLPAAASRLGTEAILPDHMDVANAVGAVTGKVVVRHSAWIRPDQQDGYFVKGLPDTGRFAGFKEAEIHARKALVAHVQTLARAAGTYCGDIELQVEDETAKTASGEELFLERRLTALLVGAPAAGMRGFAEPEGEG